MFHPTQPCVERGKGECDSSCDNFWQLRSRCFFFGWWGGGVVGRVIKKKERSFKKYLETNLQCITIKSKKSGSFLSTAGTVQRIITGNYTLQLNDNGQSVYSTASVDVTVYLPDASNTGVPFPMGAKCTIISGSNKIYLTASNSTTTHLLQSGNSNYYSSWYIPPYTVATVYRTNTVDWIIDANSLTINDD